MKGQDNLLIQNIFATMLATLTDFEELANWVVRIIISYTKSICGPFCILKFHYDQKEKGRNPLFLNVKFDQQ
jgi:hypothetical protein